MDVECRVVQDMLKGDDHYELRTRLHFLVPDDTYCHALVLPPVSQVSMDVECRVVQDMLKGDDCYELRIRLKEHRDEKFPYNEDD